MRFHIRWRIYTYNGCNYWFNAFETIYLQSTRWQYYCQKKKESSLFPNYIFMCNYITHLHLTSVRCKDVEILLINMVDVPY